MNRRVAAATAFAPILILLIFAPIAIIKPLIITIILVSAIAIAMFWFDIVVYAIFGKYFDTPTRGLVNFIVLRCVRNSEADYYRAYWHKISFPREHEIDYRRKYIVV